MRRISTLITSANVGKQLIMISAPRTASAAVAAMRTEVPDGTLAANRLARSAERFQAANSNPAAATRRAMRPPMSPSPRNAIRVMRSVSSESASSE